ncbi:hypothetical protein M1146_04240 [Patescibacteria group bacterium]|nr:hypothetical protein [Patescibacteria group bacterium]
MTDYGPSCFVERDAGGPVLDASPAVCHALTGTLLIFLHHLFLLLFQGGSSCGWSDHFSVTVTVALDDRPFGPFKVTPEEFLNMTIAGEKANALLMNIVTGEPSDDVPSASLEYHKKQHHE